MRLTTDQKTRIIEFFEGIVSPDEFIRSMRRGFDEAMLNYLTIADKDSVDGDALHDGFSSFLYFETYINKNETNTKF